MKPPKTVVRARKLVKGTQRVLNFCVNPLCLHSKKSPGCNCCKRHK